MSEQPLPPPPTATRRVEHVDDPATESVGDAVRAGQPPLARNVATELVGTVVVMLLGPGVLVLAGPSVGTLAAAIGFGVGTALAIGVIGAVANPAFTLALLLVREITPRDAVGDWAGQVLGGLVGGLMILGINDLARSPVGSNGWGRGSFSELGSVMSAELVFGVLIVVVLLATVSQGLSTASIAGFTGAAVTVAHLILIPVDGGGINPARSIGAVVFADTDPSALGQLWVFILVPLVAAIAAVFVWLLVDDAEIDDTMFDETILDDAQNSLTGDLD